MALTKKDLAARAAAIKAGKNQYTRPSDGKVWTIRNSNNPRLSKRFGGQGGTDEVLKTRRANRGSEARRAATTGQTLSEQDYLDYAKKNNYSAEQAKQLYQQNVNKLKRLTQYKSAKFNYEHLLPTTSKAYGGVEHWRNIILMGADENAAKSDKLISIESAREAKIPLSKASALQKDFANAPNPTPRQKREVVRREMQKPLPTARQKSQKFQRLKTQLQPKGGGIGLQVIEQALTKAAKSALSPSSKMMDVAAEVAGTMLPEEIQQNPMVQQTLGIMSAPLPAQAKAALTILQPTPLASGELKDNQ